MSSRAGFVSEEDHFDASPEVVSQENALSEDQDSLHNFGLELFNGHPPLMLRISKEQRSAARSHSVASEAPDPPQATSAENVVAVEPSTTTVISAMSPHKVLTAVELAQQQAFPDVGLNIMGVGCQYPEKTVTAQQLRELAYRHYPRTPLSVFFILHLNR
ncbi:hypothetical protein NM688_g639 [Phlebia brevispora]|uniref:Uncharacterized protein n=1 Tax=Phlebia brevispora TaxID=194682 RepID=A0ACC1TE05_9APHY|nr:hypothetical protein NM688_g639 [Phlebia brevispora]